MLNVALTGNVAAGKSSVLELFGRWGAFTLDADRLAREAVVPGSKALAAILARFGADLALPDGALDRAALRRRVMADRELRGALNAILHPEIRRLERERLREAERRGIAIAVSDIPLLFEAADPAEWDVVILVDAPEATRRSRLIDTKGYTGDEADAVIRAQLPSAVKRPRSHFIIDNDDSRSVLEQRARAVWDALHRIAADRREAPPR